MNRKTAIEWLEQIKHSIRGGDEDFDRQRKEALDIAIEALKAKEPRVLTLEEAKTSDVAWLERYANPYDGVDPIIQPIIIMYFKNGYFEGLIEQDEDAEITLFVDDFNMEWRFWTSRPTDEQRKAVKWDG